MAQTTLAENEVLVLVGGGKRAHVFRSHPRANAKLMALRDGDRVYDIAICGGRGQLVPAPDDAELCGTCDRLVNDDD